MRRWNRQSSGRCMRRWIRKAAALIGVSALLAGMCMTDAAAAERNDFYHVTFRIHGEGTVTLDNAVQGECVLEEGEKTLALAPGTFVKLTAQANTKENGQNGETEDNSMISITVSTTDGIELEPEALENTGTFTGKGIEFGGSLIRPEATGYGNVYFLLQMLKTKGIDIKGKVVTVSGAGNVAQYTVEKLISLGAKVVTMSDSDGYIYDPDGIDREKLDYIMELKNLYRGRIREYAEKYGVKYVPGARPWGEKCDIAMPSATQNELNGDDARTLLANGCFAVSEGANMPSTPEAIDEFLKAKILYAPGKAANAGGVSVSGLEMTQNAQKLSWSAEEVDQKLKDIMANIHEQCLKYGTQEDGYVNYVKGANVAGFMKVAKAMMAQGIL